MKKELLPTFLLFSLVISKTVFSQLTIDTIPTAQQLVNRIVGPDYTVSNVKINCATLAIGAFTGTSNVGFENGILLTTGLATSANGPNNQTNKGWNLNRTGDPQLDTLTGSQTFDGCSLEFDFMPPCDTLKIKYVFGSEEYPEYANKAFTDALGFFVSGPGITGTKNIATVPGTTLPVSVNSINATTNSQYYVSNTSGTSIQYDGFTTPLTAMQSVVPHSTYHLKIVIADGTDAIYDSGIFIETGSITCSPSVGIKENQAELSELMAYPNPAAENVTLNFKSSAAEHVTVSILDITSRKVAAYDITAQTGNNTINLDLPELENGIYFLGIEKNGKRLNKKIVIKK